MGFESAHQRDVVQPAMPPAERKEREDVRAKMQDSLQALKNEVNDKIGDGQYVDAVKAVGKTVETLLTGMGGGLKKAVDMLKMANGGKAPGWLQMALEFYANHDKTKIATMTKIMGLTIDVEKEIANKSPIASLVKSIEAAAKKRYPDAKNPLEDLAVELKGTNITSVQDILTQTNKLPPLTPPATATAATTPNPNPNPNPNTTPA